jgi:hypothetical protein
MLNVPMVGRSGFRSCGVMTFKAKKPRTMVGIPAIVSRIGLTRFRVRGVAYSARYAAASKPRGTATNSAMRATSSVPTTSGTTPNRNGRIDADHTVPKRKSIGLTKAKKASASTSSTTTIPIVVRMPMLAARMSKASMARSDHGRRLDSGRAKLVMSAPPYPERHDGHTSPGRAGPACPILAGTRAYCWSAVARSAFDFARMSGCASM